ncbi:hypothetical protein M1523_04680 [Patescibacteria group bacterium]|nr:hypothetical protein [Patescibacteria group bacterium]
MKVNEQYYKRILPGIDVCYPRRDVYVKGKRVPLLLTGVHNRLLHYLDSARPIEPDVNRIMLLVDYHPDYDMGDGIDGVHIGNWGKAGVSRSFWRGTIHLSQAHLIPSNFSTVCDSIREQDFTSLYPFPMEEADRILDVINGRPFIMSFCGDEYANWFVGLTRKKAEELRQLVAMFLPAPNLQMVHFSSTCSVYCPNIEAKKQWDVIRDEHAKYEDTL